MNLVEAAARTMEEEAREMYRANHKNWGKRNADGSSMYVSPEVTREICGRSVRVLVIAAAGNRSSVPYAKWKIDGKRAKFADVLNITAE